MSILSENLRYLRGQETQQKIANDLLITRGAYATYEDERSLPPLNVFHKISKYYRISMDLLFTVDIRKYPLDNLVDIPKNRVVLPIKVDSTGENKIEIVPYKGQMGYVNGFSDPGYIDGLQHLSLPFLRNGKYRAFPVEGDSMPPFKDKTYIIGKYIEKITEMRAGKNYLIVIRDGFVYKKLTAVGKNSIWVESDNSFFPPYEITGNELFETWEYEYSLLKDYDISDFTSNDVKEMVLAMKQNTEKLEALLKQ